MTILNSESQVTQQKQDEKIESNNLQQNLDPNLSQNNQQNQQENEDPNWRTFREGRKKDRLERELAEKKAAEKEAEIAALKAAMEAAFSKSSPSPQAYQQYYGMNQSYDQQEETEDQRVERKVNELLEKKQKEYDRQQKEYEQREYPNKLKRDFPDFGQVCSQENLDYLDYHYPEISRPLQRLQEGYDKWSDIYHAVKKLIPNHSNARKDAVKAEMNQNKPKSISSQELTQSGAPVRETWQETEQRRAANWERMQRRLKGLE